MEIYPPPSPEGKKENPLVHLVRTEPITAEVLEKITLLNHAVRMQDANKVKVLLEKEKTSAKEIKKILTFTALNEAVKGGYEGIVKALIQYEAEGPAKIAEFKVWNPSTKNKDEVSPSLHIQGKRGEFTLDFRRENQRNVLAVSNSEPNKDGIRICQLGFSAGQKGLDLEVNPGQYIHFVVKAKVPKHLINRNNYVFIQDFDGRWERKTSSFSGTGWLTHLISKKIRPGSTTLGMGIYFTPQSENDRMEIDDIKIFVSNRRR